MKLLSLVTLLFLVFSSLSTYATTEESSFKAITHKIQSLKNALLTTEQRKQNIQGNLEKIELQMSDLAQTLAKTHHHIQTQEKELQLTQAQLAQYKALLTKQHRLLNKQLYAAYILGREPLLKILLNQEDAEKIYRYLHYYQYLTKARMDIIYAIQQLSISIQKTAQTASEQTKNLKSTQVNLFEQKNNLIDQEKKRKQLLENLNNQISTQQEKLAQLYADKKALKQVIDQVSKAEKVVEELPEKKTIEKPSAKENYVYLRGKSFSVLRGKLSWPLASRKLLQSYDTPIAQSELRTTGILIAAAQNEAVHAIFSGKVVYANWLRGYGLLIIIQHDKNYLSLYGRNQTITVKTGQWVQAGENIATAGNTGGYPDTALYFEIRYQGKPQNPLGWLIRS